MTKPSPPTVTEHHGMFIAPPKSGPTVEVPTFVSQPLPTVGGGSTLGGIPVPSFMPPNGFAGLAQQTPAVQSLYRGRRSTGSGRRRKKRSAAAAPRRRKRRASSKPARLVKGSAAAKRYMAKIRRKRR